MPEPRPHAYYCHACGNVIAASLVESPIRGTEAEAEVKLVCCDQEMELLHRGFIGPLQEMGQRTVDMGRRMGLKTIGRRRA